MVRTGECDMFTVFLPDAENVDGEGEGERGEISVIGPVCSSPPRPRK